MTNTMVPEPGDVVAGKYRVVRMVGAGAMGAVVAADHLHLGRTVAIKVMTSDASEVALARFAREAQAVAKIESEHVCQVFDVGTLEDGRPYMVMELLDGEDLAQLAKNGHRFALDEVVDYVLQACEALAEAHTRGVVHRDLKPSNLFLAKRGDGTARIKLLDFGISKSLDSSESHGLTQTNAIVGSPRFMSPEQLQSSRDADARSDIWSLGVVLHELLTGQAAFEGGTLAELFVQILQEDPRPLRDARPDLPVAFERAIAGCLEKDRDDRYQNVAELALAIAPFGKPESQTCVDRIARLFEASGWSRPTSEAGLATVVMSRQDVATPLEKGAVQAAADAGPSSQAPSSRAPVSEGPSSAEPAEAASTAEPVVMSPAMSHGESTVGVSRGTSASGSPWRLVAAAVAGAALVGGVIAFTLGDADPAPAAPASVERSEKEAPTDAPQQEAPEEPQARASEEAPARAAEANENEAPEGPASAAPDRARPPTAPKPAPAPRPAPPTPVAPKPSPQPSAKPASKPAYCSGDGAFARDAQGNLKVKPECL